jgi:hypothetical protein
MESDTGAAAKLPRRQQARLAAYTAVLARWAQLDGHLEQAERAAREWPGPGSDRPGGPPLELAPGERVLAVLPALTLVEVSREPGTLRPDYTGYSARAAAALRHRRPAPPAERQRVRGHGPVTVTDRRAVFHAAQEVVEWPFGQLLRIEHAAGRPVTLLHVAGRDRVSGVLYRSRDAGTVRLVLELAAAGPAGTVLDRLAAERRQHALDLPPPPVEADPAGGGPAPRPAHPSADPAGSARPPGTGH